MTTVSSSKELKCTLLGLGLGNEARLELEKARESLSLTILIKRNLVDDVLLGHVGLPHVLPVIVHLEFFMLDGLRGSF